MKLFFKKNLSFTKNYSFLRFFSRFNRSGIEKNDLPNINDRTKVREILLQHPEFEIFLQKRFGLVPEESKFELSFKKFCHLYDLPPPSVLFMEIQLSKNFDSIHRLSAKETQILIDQNSELLIIDARESEEWSLGTLPRAVRLDETLWHRITSIKKEHPILVYCHYGVRSLDVAFSLAKKGFEKVYYLEGGIDAWSLHVDPTQERYDGHYC
jgi:rhodanese-related sulfurtransferase